MVSFSAPICLSIGPRVLLEMSVFGRVSER